MKLEKELYRYFFTVVGLLVMFALFRGMLPVLFMFRIGLVAYALYAARNFVKSGGEVDYWMDRGTKEEFRRLWAKVIAGLFVLAAVMMFVLSAIGVEEKRVLIAQLIANPVIFAISILPMMFGKREQ